MDFSPWKYTDAELYGLLLGLYVKFELVGDSDCLTELLNYIHDVALLYKQTAYHCFRHACDITYLVFFILYDLGAAEWFAFSKLEVAAMLTASLGHDSLHPGTNNLYQVNAKTDAARLFGVRSPLEKQSVYVVLQLLLSRNLVHKLDIEHDFFTDNADTALQGEFLSKLPSFKDGIDPEDTPQLLSPFADVLVPGIAPRLSGEDLKRRLASFDKKEKLFYRIVYEGILNTDMFFHFILLEDLARLVDSIIVQQPDESESDDDECECTSENVEGSQESTERMYKSDSLCAELLEAQTREPLDAPSNAVVPNARSTAGFPPLPEEAVDSVASRPNVSRIRGGEAPVPPPLAQLNPGMQPYAKTLFSTSYSSVTSNASLMGLNSSSNGNSNGRRRPLSVSSPISPLARSGLEQAERAISLHKLEGGLSSLQLKAMEDSSAALLPEFPAIYGSMATSLDSQSDNTEGSVRDQICKVTSQSGNSRGGSDSGDSGETVISVSYCFPAAEKLPTQSLRLPAAHRRLLLSAILHLADISNAARPPEIMLMWSKLVTEEFVQQSDLEKKYGLPVSPSMDRETYSQARSSVDFNQLVVRPTFELLADVLPPVGVFVQWCDHNKALWQSELESDASPFGRGSLRHAASTNGAFAGDRDERNETRTKRGTFEKSLLASEQSLSLSSSKIAEEEVESESLKPVGAGEPVSYYDSTDTPEPVRCNESESSSSAVSRKSSKIDALVLGGSKSPANRLKSSFFDSSSLGRERRLSVAAGTVEIPAFMMHNAQAAASLLDLSSSDLSGSLSQSLNTLGTPTQQTNALSSGRLGSLKSDHQAQLSSKGSLLENVLIISPAPKNTGSISQLDSADGGKGARARKEGGQLSNSTSILIGQSSGGAKVGTSEANSSMSTSALQLERGTGEFPFLFHYQKYHHINHGGLHHSHQHTSGLSKHKPHGQKNPSSDLQDSHESGPLAADTGSLSKLSVKERSLSATGAGSQANPAALVIDESLRSSVDSGFGTGTAGDGSKGKSPVVGRWGKLFIAAQTLNQHPKNSQLSSAEQLVTNKYPRKSSTTSTASSTKSKSQESANLPSKSSILQNSGKLKKVTEP